MAPHSNQPVVLLLGLRPEEEDAVVRSPGPQAVRFLPTSDSELARRMLPAEPVTAVVCPFAAFSSLEAELAARPKEPARLAVLVLIPPGEEVAAASLWQREGVDVLLRAGNYLPLLSGWLGAALARPGTSWEEIGRIVRHEINNPLTGVLGNAELILAGAEELSPGARKRLRTIVQLAVRMRDVVRDLEVRLRRQERPLKPHLPSDGSSLLEIPLRR